MDVECSEEDDESDSNCSEDLTGNTDDLDEATYESEDSDDSKNDPDWVELETDDQNSSWDDEQHSRNNIRYVSRYIIKQQQ